jgi:hypothetical protein
MANRLDDLWPDNLETVDIVLPVVILKFQATALGKQITELTFIPLP